VTQGPVRASHIEIGEVEDGYVVYDRARDRVHYLNHTAALVLELCTGDNEASSIAGLLRTAYELPEPPVEEIEGCLEQLREEGLIA
jgi:coenzyme PQQ synthesis protein D (PqqD)